MSSPPPSLLSAAAVHAASIELLTIAGESFRRSTGAMRLLLSQAAQHGVTHDEAAEAAGLPRELVDALLEGA